MTWADAVGLAWRGVRRRAGRAVLTVLAVALAATLLVALLTVAGTAQTRVLSQLTKGGPLAGIKVAAAAPDLTQIDQDNARPGAPRQLGEATVTQIAALPDVASVVSIRSAPVLVQAARPAGIPLPPGVTSLPRGTGDGRTISFTETQVGVDLTRLRELPVTLLAGRFPGPGSTTEVAVTTGYLERFGIGKADAARVIGTELTVGAPRAEGVAEGVGVGEGEERRTRGRWRRMLIVGVDAQEAAPGQLLTDVGEVERGREWSLGGALTAQERESVGSPYAGLFVTSTSLDKVSIVRARITAIGFSTSAPENLVASVTRYLQVVQIVLSGIGLIALVIASLGITNAMLAAVRERRREIGVLKAIGARDSDVLRVFLVEAVVLGLVGGVLGTLAGWGVATAVAAVVNGYLTSQGLVGVTTDLPALVAVGGVLGSGLLALLAGAVPALRAARLPAREAIGSA